MNVQMHETDISQIARHFASPSRAMIGESGGPVEIDEAEFNRRSAAPQAPAALATSATMVRKEANEAISAISARTSDIIGRNIISAPYSLYNLFMFIFCSKIKDDPGLRFVQLGHLVNEIRTRARTRVTPEERLDLPRDSYPSDQEVEFYA